VISINRISELSICNDGLRKIYGPSSSHTYGAARIAYYAYNIFYPIEGNCKAQIYLIKGTEKAYNGHATDRAIIAALLGYNPYNETFEEAKNIEIKVDGNKVKVTNYDNIEFEFFIDENEDIDVPNAAFAIKIKIQDQKKEIELIGRSLGGGDIQIDEVTSEPPEYLVKLDNKKRKKEQPGFWRSEHGIRKLRSSKYNIKSFDDLLKLAYQTNKSISDIAIEREKILLNEKEENIINHMKKNWELMKESIQKGLNGQYTTELSDELIGIPPKMINHKEYTISNTVAYALAVMLLNSSMGRVVSCPTAGSAGIVPAVAYTFLEKNNNKDAITLHEIENKIIKSLFTAGIICLIVKNKASVSGQQHGCQAECGVARAMAAAMLTELHGGDIYQVINAATLAIKNSLGLTCDPVGGLVEIPCIKRNGACAVGAQTDAIMSLSGINSLIKPDEVLAVMKEVGEKMDEEYKETAKGGLAVTPTAKAKMIYLERNSPRYLISYKKFNFEEKYQFSAI